MMVGSDLAECRLQPARAGRCAARAARASRRRTREPFGTDLKSITLEVRAGEIVGIAGVSGNGQKELLARISGETPGCDSGACVIEGQRAGTARPDGSVVRWASHSCPRSGWGAVPCPRCPSRTTRC